MPMHIQEAETPAEKDQDRAALVAENERLQKKHKENKVSHRSRGQKSIGSWQKSVPIS